MISLCFCFSRGSVSPGITISEVSLHFGLCSGLSRHYLLFIYFISIVLSVDLFSPNFLQSPIMLQEVAIKGFESLNL